MRCASLNLGLSDPIPPLAACPLGRTLWLQRFRLPDLHFVVRLWRRTQKGTNHFLKFGIVGRIRFRRLCHAYSTVCQEISPQDVFDPLFRSIGYLVVNWTFVESSLNAWITVIYHMAGGKHVESVLPLELKRKRKFLRRCFGQIEALRPWKDEAITLLDRTNPIADVRHFVIHGTVSHYDKAADHSITFVRIDRKDAGTMHVTRELTITGADLLQRGTDALELTPKMIDLAHRLIDALVPKDNQQELLGSL